MKSDPVGILMSDVRPGIFFDSCVCIDAAKGSFPGDWPRTWKYIQNNFRYFISPIAVIELLTGIQRGDESHFAENKRALQILYPTHPKRFLRYARSHVCHLLFGKAPPKFSELDDKFELWVRAVLASRNKADIEAGKFHVTGRRRFSFRLSDMVTQMDKKRAEFAADTHRVRGGEIQPSTREQWVKLALVEGFQQADTAENRDLLDRALDAVIHYEHQHAKRVLTSNLSLNKTGNINTFIDAHQLYYLCDPNLYFLTGESRFKEWTTGSPQNSRILLYDDVKSWL